MKEYVFERAKSSLEKARRMAEAFRDGGFFNFSVFATHLTNSVSLAAGLLTGPEHDGFETHEVLKQVLDAKGFDPGSYETFFFIKGLGSKQLKKHSRGLTFTDLKNSKTLSAQDLMLFVDNAEDFLKGITSSLKL